MSDTITGTSILWGAPGNRWLFVVCHAEGKRTFQEHIPVQFHGDPQHRETVVWLCEFKGTWLHVSPSLRVSNQIKGEWVDVFHNTAQWDTPYKEPPDGFTMDEARALHHYLNHAGFAWDDAVNAARKKREP